MKYIKFLIALFALFITLSTIAQTYYNNGYVDGIVKTPLNTTVYVGILNISDLKQKEKDDDIGYCKSKYPNIIFEA